MMQMPTQDHITMSTRLQFQVFAGFIVVLLLNYWLVKKEGKMGAV